jgi:hypothetical protein
VQVGARGGLRERDPSIMWWLSVSRVSSLGISVLYCTSRSSMKRKARSSHFISASFLSFLSFLSILSIKIHPILISSPRSPLSLLPSSSRTPVHSLLFFVPFLSAHSYCRFHCHSSVLEQYTRSIKQGMYLRLPFAVMDRCIVPEHIHRIPVDPFTSICLWCDS